MKRIKYLLLLIPFLFINSIKAQIINSSVYMNGSEIDTRGYVYLTSNEYSALKITATNTEPSGYFRVQACFDSNVTAYNISPTANFSNPLVVVTNTPCRYYNSSYEGGTVTNFYFDYDVSDSGAGSFTTTFNFLHFGGSFQLLSVSSSTTPYDVTSGLSDFDISSLEQQQKNIYEEQKKTNEEQKKTNDTLTDDNVTDSTNKANEFFSGFTTDTFGLTSIITAPLELIGSITSSTCSPLGLKVPFVENKNLNLPCMSSIYQQHFGSFLTIYQTITFGIIAYWVCVRIFALVKDFKNPDTDKVEVLDL